MVVVVSQGFFAAVAAADQLFKQKIKIFINRQATRLIGKIQKLKMQKGNKKD